MKIRCFPLRKLLPKYFIIFLSLSLIIVLLKSVCVKNNSLIAHDGTTSGISKIQNYNNNGINCTSVYQLDPVEIGKSLEFRRKNVVDLDDNDITSLTSDCRKFKKDRGYGNLPTSEEEQRFPLAYSLVVHKHASMVERILRAIYMPQNVYCIHYDKKSTQNFISAIENLAKCFPNVFIASKLESVQYADISRLRADLNCLSDLLRSAVKWRYVINLCGQDFPLRSNSELVTQLKGLQGKNMLESSRPSELKKLRFKFQHVLKDVPYEYQKLPVRTTQAKELPPHGVDIFTGSAYFVLSREFVEHFNSSSLAEDLLAWSADTYSPDEHFWATLVRVPGVPGEIPRSAPDVTDLMSKTRLVKWSYLEGSLYPACTGIHTRSVCVYGAAELRWLLTYGHWFANKVDHKVDPVLITCLEKHLGDQQRKKTA